MPTRLLTLDTTEAIASRLADLLAEAEPPLADVAGAFDLGDGRWRMEAYFAEAPDLARLDAAIGEASDGALAIGHAGLRLLDGADYAEAGLDTLPPIRAGRFRVYGEHNAPPAAGLGRFDLTIEAASAFGTGDHASTHLALLALDAELKRRRPRRVLDLGCGTGILAVATGLAAPARLTASDLAPIAVRMTAANARANGLAPRLRPVLAAGLGHPVLRAAAPFDLVLANILPGPLTALAGAVGRVLTPGGRVVLAGLRIGEQARLVARYRAAGLRLVRRLAAKEWAALVLERPPLVKRSR